MADILRRKQTPLIGIPEWLVHQRNLEFQSRISNTVARPNLNSEKAKKIGIGNRRMPYGGEQHFFRKSLPEQRQRHSSPRQKTNYRGRDPYVRQWQHESRRRLA
ncbi:MAG TPA: hypothetical protein QF861_13725, partial [Alphaproteobacteria bacterium]|nr:hypothetical protein [Alphaproteobacteria bacterium]